MNEGKIFEEDFKKSVPQNTYYMRIKDPASSFGDNSNLRFSHKNPFDALIYCYPNLFFLELKSTKSTSYSFSLDKKEKSKMIKANQIEELTKAAHYKGIIPGFLFNMRKYNKTYFLHIRDFNRFISEVDKKSINQDDIIKYGGIEVRGELKVKRYKYYVGEFIEKCQENEE